MSKDTESRLRRSKPDSTPTEEASKRFDPVIEVVRGSEDRREDTGRKSTGSFWGFLRPYGRARRFRIKGYTTPARVAEKMRREQRAHRRNQLIATIIILGLIVTGIVLLDPLPKISEFLKAMGF
ncbi:MAG: hypothetical protein GX900_08530 [Clostridiaceae bacterium]|nr:hypothetical protein [Clostridiaceae bacterium]